MSKYNIDEVFGCAFIEMTRIDWANPEKMNLHSPFRQCSYIASLALSVEQNDKMLPLDEDAWKAICHKANKIYDYYALMYFPKDGDFSKITEERHDKGGVAMVATRFVLVAAARNTRNVMEHNYSISCSPF